MPGRLLVVSRRSVSWGIGEDNPDTRLFAAPWWEVDDIDTITVIAKMRIIEVRFFMAYKIIVNDYLVGYRIRNYNEIALKMQEQ